MLAMNIRYSAIDISRFTTALPPLLLAAVVLIPATAQVSPAVDGPRDAQELADWNARAQVILDQQALQVLQGRPAVAIWAIIQAPDASSDLNNASARDAVELALRRNGIPIVPSCENGSNCGRIVPTIWANCTKGLFPADPSSGPTDLCAAYVKVVYQEFVHTSRSNANPTILLRDMWLDDSLGIVISSELGDRTRKRMTESIEKFALYYLRANPAK